MAQAQPKAPRDRHPELCSPILDLSLEARIARAEQRVVDRDARVRGDAARIVGTLRSKRGAAGRWAAIGVGAVAIGTIGYVGWHAWRGCGAARRDEESGAARGAKSGPGLLAGIAALARTAAQWALMLHREQGVAGSLVGMARSLLWPSATPPPAAGSPPR